MDDKEHKYWDNFIRNLCDLNYIKPFRHLIHYILHWLKTLQERIDEFGTYVTQEVFDALEKRVATNEDNIEDLEENKADKSDLEDLEGRVDDNESAIDDLEEDLGNLTDNVSDIEERVTTNENNITDLQNDKADKADVEEYEEKTDGRLDNLEECCEEVGEHLEQVDGRLDTDEDNIDTLLDNMIVLSDHNGIIATDNYFEDYLDVNMDDLVREMAQKGIMKYEIYTSYYPERENWVSEIHDAVKEIYGYEWENNFAFIEVDNILFGGTSPRVMVKLIPRERDVYVCMCYHVGNIEEAFDGHCFLHRTPTEDLEERIEKCEERLDEHDEMLEALQEADKVFEERIGKLEECCDVVNETLDDFDKRITKAQGTADQADAKADHNAEDISHLEDDMVDVRNHADKAVEEASEAKDAAEQAQKDAESAAEDAKDAQEKAEEAAEKVDQFDGRITKNEEDISNLEECCEEVQETLEDQDSRIEANESAIDDLKENKADKDELPDEYVESFEGMSFPYSNEHMGRLLRATYNDGTEYDYVVGSVGGFETNTTQHNGYKTVTITPYTSGLNGEGTLEDISFSVPDAYDDTEIQEKIADLEEKVANNEVSIEELKSEIEDIKASIPDEYLKSFHTTYQSDSDNSTEYTDVYATDNNNTNTHGYSGDMSGIDVERKENSDGSITYTLTPKFVGGSSSSTRSYGSYTIEVPAGYDDTEIRNMITDLQTRVSKNETSITNIESEISDLQSAVNDAVTNVGIYYGMSTSSYGYRTRITQTKNGNTTDVGYSGNISNVKMSETENSDGSKSYELTKSFVNNANYEDVKIGDIEVPESLLSKVSSWADADIVKQTVSQISDGSISEDKIEIKYRLYSCTSDGLEFQNTTYTLYHIIREGDVYVATRSGTNNVGRGDFQVYQHGNQTTSEAPGWLSLGSRDTMSFFPDPVIPFFAGTGTYRLLIIDTSSNPGYGMGHNYDVGSDLEYYALNK